METRPHVAKYFAGTLSGGGFTNFLPSAIDGMKKIYIIKGTAGSGKSTLMKKIASAAEAAGENVERIYCSSDPNSLDGVVIPVRSFAIVDGTAPHVMEASYPKAIDTIINTGDFISEKEIERSSDEIIKLSDEKKVLFRQAQSLLYTASVLSGIERDLTEGCYDKAKGFRFCRNVILKEQKFKKEGEVLQKVFLAFGKNGVSSLCPTDSDVNIFSVGERFSSFILGTLKLLATEYKLCAVCSPDPLEITQTGAIYFPESKRFYVSSAYYSDEEKISSKRFEITELSGRNKEKTKFLKKTKALILKEAQSYIKEAMICHESLEKIYVSALNKEGLDCLAQSIIISLFGNS